MPIWAVQPLASWEISRASHRGRVEVVVDELRGSSRHFYLHPETFPWRWEGVDSLTLVLSSCLGSLSSDETERVPL